MAEVRKLKARRNMATALRTRNGPDITDTLELPIFSEIKVWKKNIGWTGPYILLGKTRGDMTCSVSINGRSVNFRTTLVKFYHRNGDNTPADDQKPPVHDTPEPPRRRGRPKGSKNKPKPAQTEPPRRNPKRKIKHHDVHVSKKEAADLALALQLRRKSKIITSKKPFE
jgi:hypothetical protein